MASDQAIPAASFPCLLNSARLCHQFLLPDDEFWGSHLQRFPRSHRSRQALFEVDRILPLPKDAREGLIERYFDHDKQDSARADPENGDCLARVYLGRRESEEEQGRVYDTLRNFPLYLNMLEEMNYDIVGLAQEMGIGLAVLHFEAGVDAMDTEFVLGACTDEERPSGFADVDAPPQKISKKPVAGLVQMWMLDFDKARRINITNCEQVQGLAVSFLGNDPYFPTPDEPHLWERFSWAYTKAGDKILASKGLKGDEDLIVRGGPRLVLESVKSRWQQMKIWEAEHDIVFGD